MRRLPLSPRLNPLSRGLTIPTLKRGARLICQSALSQSAQSRPHHSDSAKACSDNWFLPCLNPLSRGLTIPTPTCVRDGEGRIIGLNPLSRGLTIPTASTCRRATSRTRSQSAQSRPHHSDSLPKTIPELPCFGLNPLSRGLTIPTLNARVRAGLVLKRLSIRSVAASPFRHCEVRAGRDRRSGVSIRSVAASPFRRLVG